MNNNRITRINPNIGGEILDSWKYCTSIIRLLTRHLFVFFFFVMLQSFCQNCILWLLLATDLRIWLKLTRLHLSRSWSFLVFLRTISQRDQIIAFMSFTSWSPCVCWISGKSNKRLVCSFLPPLQLNDVGTL